MACATRASVADQGAVLLPEAADRRLAGAKRLRLGVIAAHHHDTAVVVVEAQGALSKAADATVLHRDVPGGADQIALPQAPLGHRLVVVLEAQMDPVELGLFEAARPDHPNRNRIADLLQYHARKDRQDLHRDAVPIFVDRLDNRGILETEIAVRAQSLAIVIGVLGGIVELGLAEMIAAAIVDVYPARHAQPVDV